MTDSTSIILAAIGAAGPVGDDPAGWRSRVEELTSSITVMVSERSPLVTLIAKIESCSNFVGSVISVRKEQSSTRAVVTLHTGTTKSNTDALTGSPLPEGMEQLRTDRTDTPSGLRMARTLGELIGHRVLVWKEEESFTSGGDTKKSRIVRHVEPLGVSDQPDAVAALEARKLQRASQVA